MTKNFIYTFLVCTFLIACSTEDDNTRTSEEYLSELEIELTAFEDEYEETTDRNGKHRNCNAMHVLSKNLNENPSLKNKLAVIEKHTQNAIAFKKGGNGNGNNGGGPGGGGGGTDPTPYVGTVNIPVVVHVVYANSQENISSAQINSQIDVLNQDFNATNSDLNPPSEFSGVVGDCDIQFTLDQVIRVAGDRSTWGTSDAVKSYSPVVDPARKLNIWVCNIGGGILGYAQFPGGSASTDGVVVSPQYFGSTGYVSAPFNKGRTTTHEVGHYLNLRHIWGDGRCKRDDFVADTPTSDRANYGCPNSAYHCRTNDMYMNYMDYVDDACMFMFSEGQKDRMRALFAVGGARESMVN